MGADKKLAHIVLQSGQLPVMRDVLAEDTTEEASGDQ
jgi:hypothetical protein